MDTKISNLTALTDVDDTNDSFAVVDDSATATKKITWGNFRTTIATYLASLAQTLTNKTISLTSNTVSGTTAEFNTALSDGDFATLAGTETLTNKTLTAPSISTITNTGTVTLPTATTTLVGTGTTDTLTNKTIDGDDNTLQDIAVSSTKLVAGTGLTLSTDTLNADSASDSVVGVVELATAAETTTGTDATRAVTPDGLAGSDFGIRYVQPVVFDFTTDTATGDGKFYFHVPAGMDGMNLVEVHAEVITAGTTGTTDIQIHNVDNALDMLSTKLTIDSGETGSDTAATPAVINTSNDHVNENDVVRIDVDAVSTTAAKGLIVTMGFQLP